MSTELKSYYLNPLHPENKDEANFLDTYADDVSKNCPIITGQHVTELPRLNSVFNQNGKLIDVTCTGAMVGDNAVFDRTYVDPTCEICPIRKK